jgi:hypothetical protein
MTRLKPHHFDVLRLICDRGAVPANELDGRILRPLLSSECIVEVHGIVRPTPAGRSTAAQAPPVEARPSAGTGTPAGVFSAKQEEVLRYLLRQTGPVPEEHLDGRVLRALRSRRLVEETRGWVSPTREAEPFLRSHSQQTQRRSRRQAMASARSARGEAILRAVEQLERALPKDAEVSIAAHPAYADDVLAGLRRFVREMC